MWKADLSGGIAFVFGAEGKGLRPLVRRTCDLEVSIPLLGRGRVAQRQRRRRAPPLRGAEAARWLSRPSTSSTASTCCTRASSARRRNSATCWRAGSPRRAPAACSCSTARDDRAARPARGALGQGCGRAARALAAEHRSKEQVAIVSSDTAVRGTAGSRGAQARVADIPRASSRGRASREAHGGDLRDRLDPDTLAQLERLRRGEC